MRRPSGEGQRRGRRIPRGAFGYGGVTSTVPFIICVWKMQS